MKLRKCSHEKAQLKKRMITHNAGNTFVWIEVTKAGGIDSTMAIRQTGIGDPFIKLMEVSHPSSGWTRKTEEKGLRTESRGKYSSAEGRSGSDLRSLKLSIEEYRPSRVDSVLI